MNSIKKTSVFLILLLFATVSLAQVEWPISSRNVSSPSRLRRLLQSRFDNVEADIEAILAQGTGNFYYADSGRSNAATIDGKSWIKAEPTIDDAINNCTANNGDVIFVAQGHTLTKSVTGALFTADVAGVSIICLGQGDNRAKLILSHTGAKIDITADNVRFSNFYLDATGVDSVNTPLNISGEGCILDNFFIRLADSHGQADVGITIGIADGDANDLIIANGIIESPDGGAASAVTFAKDMANVIISNLYIYGDCSTAGIDVPNGAEAQVNLNILDCVVLNLGGDDHAIEIYGTGNTGAIVNCTLISDAAATILDAGGLQVSHDTDLIVIGNAQPAAMPADKGIYDLLGAYTADAGADDEDTIMAHLDLILTDTGTTLDTIVDALNVQLGVGEATGDTDKDDSEADYTTYITLLTVTAPATGLINCRIDIDFNKSTTGWDNVATAADTLDVVAVVQVDGTNYRSMQIASAQITANGNGTLDDSESGMSFIVGPMAPNASIVIKIKESAERGDCEFPYRVTYTGAAPTVTAVAAA